MRGARTLVAAWIAGVVLAGCATVEIRQTRVVTGQVTDESGRPVANSPVVIVGRTLDLVTRRMEYEERERQEVRGKTDAEGRYRIELVPAAVGNNFFSPTPDTVAAGQVTFSWATPSNGHTIAWDSGPGTLPASTGTITSGTKVFTLVPGRYEYHCAIHGGRGTGMHGTIVVQ